MKISPNLFTFHCFLVILFITKSVTSNHIVNTLPGFSGTLPFKLETGYISIGEDEDIIHLFYYFVESERDPDRDPLLLWLTGGPGCSGFSGLVYEIGPLFFDLSSFDWTLPSLLQNPYSWTKVANIIFIDSPVGTGFSYANTSQGYVTSDTKSAKDNYTFLRKWLMNHPRFLKNQLYIAGDSYGGKFVPMVTFQIDQGNEDGLEPRMNLQGYILGNPVTDLDKDHNERIPYVHRMGLISDRYFELAKSSCNGEYINPDPDDYKCLYALQLITECIKLIQTAHILEPLCTYSSPKKVYVEDFPSDLLVTSKQDEHQDDSLWCRDQNYLSSYVWANDESVQETLNVRKGTIKDWERCNRTLFAYEYDVESVVNYHKLLNDKGYQALVYSGDHDLSIPYLGTLKWIYSLNLTINDEWRPWNVDGQIAGYTEVYMKNQAFITFATVKGAGHTAPEYKPKECLAMLTRWLSLFPL